MEASTDTVEQQEAAAEIAHKKAEHRKAVLVKLFRSKREKEADDLLEDIISKDENLLNGFRHNKFGAFCLQAGDLTRAEEHLLKAK